MCSPYLYNVNRERYEFIQEFYPEEKTKVIFKSRFQNKLTWRIIATWHTASNSLENVELIAFCLHSSEASKYHFLEFSPFGVMSLLFSCFFNSSFGSSLIWHGKQPFIQTTTNFKKLGRKKNTGQMTQQEIFQWGYFKFGYQYSLSIPF